MESADCPECFGKSEKSGRLERCRSCKYSESCAFCAKDDGSGCDRRLGHVSYERYSFSKEVSDNGAITPDADTSEDDGTRRVMEFLLDIDNYSAELLHAVLHGDCATSSDLARKFGISRQAVHRKIVDCCTLHPELRKLFITRLYRCRRLLTDSRRLTQQREKREAAAKECYHQERFDF